MTKLKRVIIANRGAVAHRVIRALRKLGIESVAVYSEADADLPYVREADMAIAIGPAPATRSYLDQAAILKAARESGADGLHPGYGFLSENAEFAEKVQDCGLIFIGPSPHWIRTLGHKTQARDLMRELGMPMVASSSLLNDDAQVLRQAAQDLGYPVLIKPAAGGGGIGMLQAHSDGELIEQWSRAQTIATRSFGRADLYLEKLVMDPRHIEFQILADRNGKVRCLFERDCSTQRRHQKVIEEAPAPALPRSELEAMAAKLEHILERLRYDVIGTVEMLYTPQTGFSFLEMNTRLQVEHAVTEEVTGIDLVSAQVRLAAGEPLDAVLPQPPGLNGHAVQARVYAEDPTRFLPSPGMLKAFAPPSLPDIRVETGYGAGCRVSSHYDPMLAKVIAHGATRDEAIDRLKTALAEFQVEGVKTNIPFILKVLNDADFIAGRVSTGLSARIIAAAQSAA
ncbi:acetyl-CoA carboxylase biotin carboxylase subunit [Bordetella sp. 2513F-2]